MKKLELLLVVITFCFTLVGVARAGSSANHMVKVTVNPINEVGISGGNVKPTINSYDNTICDLKWTTNEVSKKITVATDNGAPNFILNVVAENVKGGIATTEVTLSTTATDFISGISKTNGNCNLRYTAEAIAANITVIDRHTITYTIIDP